MSCVLQVQVVIFYLENTANQQQYHGGAAMFHSVEVLVEQTGLFVRTSRTRFAKSDCPVLYGLTNLRLKLQLQLVLAQLVVLLR